MDFKPSFRETVCFVQTAILYRQDKYTDVSMLDYILLYYSGVGTFEPFPLRGVTQYAVVFLFLRSPRPDFLISLTPIHFLSHVIHKYKYNIYINGCTRD